MPIALYDLSVRSYLQSLKATTTVLAKGAEHFAALGETADDFLEARLHPDMLPFKFQVQSVVHHSLGAIKGARSGVFEPTGQIGLKTYADLQALVADAELSLQALSREEVNALEGRDLVFRLSDKLQLPFKVEDFIVSFSLPNFYFHSTTTYGLLRREGVKLGKRDYIGQLKLNA